MYIYICKYINQYIYIYICNMYTCIYTRIHIHVCIRNKNTSLQSPGHGRPWSGGLRRPGDRCSEHKVYIYIYIYIYNTYLYISQSLSLYIYIYIYAYISFFGEYSKSEESFQPKHPRKDSNLHFLLGASRSRPRAGTLQVGKGGVLFFRPLRN